MMTTSGGDEFIFFIRIEIVIGCPENCMGHGMKIWGEGMKGKAITHMGHKQKAVTWAMRMCGL